MEKLPLISACFSLQTAPHILVWCGHVIWYHQQNHVICNEEVRGGESWEDSPLRNCCFFYGLDMFYTEVVLGFKLLLFLHVVAQFRINGQQKWPVPYRYKDRTPFHVHSAL